MISAAITEALRNVYDAQPLVDELTGGKRAGHLTKIGPFVLKSRCSTEI